MMAVSAYPKRLHPRDWRGFAILWIAGLLAFALTFAASWYFPGAGVIWVGGATVQLLYSLVFDRKALLRSVAFLLLTCGAVMAAVALQ